MFVRSFKITPIFHLEDGMTRRLAKTTLFPNKLTKSTLSLGDHINNSRGKFSIANYKLTTCDQATIYPITTHDHTITLKNGKWQLGYNNFEFGSNFELSSCYCD